MHFTNFTSIEQFKEWLNNGGNINEQTSVFKLTPLIAHVIQGNTEIVKFLVSKGADINKCDIEHRTAFMYICKHGYMDLFDYFVENLKVNADYMTRTGNSALNIACAHNQIDVVKKLLNLNVRIEGYDWSAIHHACFGIKKVIPNSVEILDHLIMHGANLNLQICGGATPLHLAVAVENLPIIDRLLSMNVNINLVNNNGQTALDCAKMYANNYDDIEAIFNKYA